MPAPQDSTPRVSTPHDPATRRHLRNATAITALSAAAIAVLWAQPLAAFEFGEAALDWLRNGSDANRATATTVLVATSGLAYVIAWTLVSSPRRPLRLPANRGTITVDEVARRLRALLLDDVDVLDAGVRVDNLHGRGVGVDVALTVTAHARLAETSEASTMAIKQYLGDIDLTLARPVQLAVSYEELILNAPRTARHTTQGSRTTDAA
jgi:hypothetical protein